MLITIVIEALSRMISTMLHRGLLSGFIVGSRNGGQRTLLWEVGMGANIPHLFVNYRLAFCEARHDHICHLCLFLYFELLSELKVNLAKSILLPVGGVANVSKHGRDLLM